jgi:hypothetical protein
MSFTTNQKFSLRADPRRPGSTSHRSLLPVLDLTSAVPGTSIHVPINTLSFWVHISYYNVFLDVSYVLLKGHPKIHPDAPRNACGVRTATE